MGARPRLQAVDELEQRLQRLRGRGGRRGRLTVLLHHAAGHVRCSRWVWRAVLTCGERGVVCIAETFWMPQESSALQPSTMCPYTLQIHWRVVQAEVPIIDCEEG